MTHARLLVFLSTSNVYSEKWFGFWKQHPINHDLIKITEKVNQGCDSGKFASGVLLDFQEAFNTVNCDILLMIFEYHGICNKSDKWFRLFLEVREKLGPLINLSE